AFWSRSSNRLQVWLERPAAEAEVRWTGSVPRPGDGDRFDVPTVRLLTPAAPPLTLHVAAREGWALEPAEATRLLPAPGTGTGGRAWEYRHDVGQPYRASFRVRPAAGVETDFRLTTVAAVREGRFTSTTTVEADVHQGELRNLLLTLRHAAGMEV